MRGKISTWTLDLIQLHDSLSILLDSTRDACRACSDLLLFPHCPTHKRKQHMRRVSLDKRSPSADLPEASESWLGFKKKKKA